MAEARRKGAHKIKTERLEPQTDPAFPILLWQTHVPSVDADFGDFVASIAWIALTRLQGYQSDWRGIQGVSGITNNKRYIYDRRGG